jgi:surfactin synthase thioesterase subunit
VDLPDGPFLDFLIQRLGAPPELRDDADLRELLLPLLRSDLRWCRSYRYHPSARLETMIVALAGDADTEATAQRMAGWARYGERFRLMTLPGGHFFVSTATRELTAILAADLLGAVTERWQ